MRISGAQTFSAIVTNPINANVTIAIANALRIDCGAMRRPNISILSRPVSTFRMLSIHIANVVTFMPPPVDIGAQPIHISIMVNASEIGLKASIGTML